MFEHKSRIFDNEILRHFFDEPASEKNAVPSSPLTSAISPQISSEAAAQNAAPVSGGPAIREEKPAKLISAKLKKNTKKGKLDVPSEPQAPPFIVPPSLFQRKGRVFSVINQKGGCGKTTTSINLAAGLAREGFEVLLIDIDAQANATLGYGVRTQPEEETVYHVFRGKPVFGGVLPEPHALIRKTRTPGVSLLPSSKSLAQLAGEILALKGWEYILRQYLGTVKDTFHYVVIDCPPALNALTVNALTASDQMIIPLQTHYFSLEGMKELFLTVRSVQEKLNPLLKSGLILPTLYDKRARINRDMLDSIRNYFKDKVLESVIHVNVKLVESVMHGEPVFSYHPSSRGAQDYGALVRELIGKDEVIFDGKSEEFLAKFIMQQ